MQDIPIYKAESSLAEQIQKQTSIAYVVPLEQASATDIQKQIIQSVASLGADSKIVSLLNSHASKNDSDLYFTKSILVSTVWNKNDDVFLPGHTWAARHTPSHKPTNLEHDENQLVGHIVDCWAMDEDGTLIQDNCTVDELPDKFHLVTGAVIYKNWEGEDLQDRTHALIQAIEAQQKFVSMEVLFTDFDYGIQTPDGSYHTTARTEDTAWMTKHLKRYGGTGSYNDYRIGRVLKNMTFSGKGYVDKPANPESVIFSAGDNCFKFSTASELTLLEDNGVLTSSEGTCSSNNNFEKVRNMADDFLKDQNDELKKTVASLEGKLVEVNDKLAKADVAKYEAEIKELGDSLASANQTAETANTQLKEATAKVEALEADLTKANEAQAELETKLAEVETAKITANRISTLVDGGIAKDDATTKVETFANLSDEQFTVVADELIKAAKAQVSSEQEESEASEETNESEEEETESGEANAEEEVLENAEENEEEVVINAAASDEEVDELAETRKELVAAIAAQLGHKITTDSEEGED